MSSLYHFWHIFFTKNYFSFEAILHWLHLSISLHSLPIMLKRVFDIPFRKISHQCMLNSFLFLFLPFYFILSMNGRASISFGRNFDGSFDDLHVLTFPECKNLIFSSCLLCMWVLLAQLKNKLYQKHQILYSTCVPYVDAIWNFLWKLEK